jgi:hypothetical protein
MAMGTLPTVCRGVSGSLLTATAANRHLTTNEYDKLNRRICEVAGEIDLVQSVARCGG